MMIDRPLADCAAWVEFYTQAQIPVLKRTARALAELREQEDAVNGRTLSGVILSDPLMVLKVLAYMESHRRARQLTDIVTIDRAIMMMGITPFFQTFENLPLVEDQLKEHPRALLGLFRVISRAHHAAEYAHEWALLRHDLDVEEITIAALLSHAAELLSWCFAPELCFQVQEHRKNHPNLRTQTAQTQVFGLSATELQHALAEAWHLPKLLQELWHDRDSDNPRILNVALAIDFARHAANGWNDPALPDDLKAIQNLLHLNHEAVLQRLHLDLNDLPPSLLHA